MCCKSIRSKATQAQTHLFQFFHASQSHVIYVHRYVAYRTPWSIVQCSLWVLRFDFLPHFFFSRFFYCHLFCSQSRDFSAAVWINVCNRKHVWWQLFFFMPRRRATFLYFVFVDLPLIVHNQYLKLAFIRCDLLSMRGLVPCNSRTESVL